MSIDCNCVIGSRVDVGSARLDLGPSIGLGIEATKEIASIAYVMIPDVNSVAFAFVCPAGKNVEFTYNSPTVQIGSWRRTRADDGKTSEEARRKR